MVCSWTYTDRAAPRMLSSAEVPREWAVLCVDDMSVQADKSTRWVILTTQFIYVRTSTSRYVTAVRTKTEKNTTTVADAAAQATPVQFSNENTAVPSNSIHRCSFALRSKIPNHTTVQATAARCGSSHTSKSEAATSVHTVGSRLLDS